MASWEPTILTEDTSPAAKETCTLCELCGHGSRVIWGEGNPAAPIFVVLDNPGARENKEGKPYLCSTRETLQMTAYEVGLNPDSFYISYILKCRPRKAYDKKTARDICIKYLWGQLDKVKPEVVFVLGNVACQAFFGDPTVEVKNIRGRIHEVRNYKTTVSYHPLAIRRRPVLYKYFFEDWELTAKQIQT